MSTIQETADAATAMLPEHIADYVQTIRPHMAGDDVVIEFKPGVRALDGRDVVRLAAILIGVGHNGLVRRSVTVAAPNREDI